MSRRWRAALLRLAALAQALVLVGVWVYSQYPLWVGRDVRLALAPPASAGPGSPRSDEVKLAIDSLPIPDSGVPRAGQSVYVSLVHQGAIWNARRVGYRPPGQGLYLSGTIVAVHFDRIEVRYGLDGGVAGPLKPPGRGGVATVKVAPDGRAALVAVRPAPG